MLGRLIEEANRMKDGLEIIALPGDMYLIIPKQQRHKRCSIVQLVVIQHLALKLLMVMFDNCRMISNLLAEVLA
jgi:hypothetical protein